MGRRAIITDKIELSYDTFVTGLFITLSRQQYTAMIPPELDTCNLSDQAAVKTFKRLNEQYPDIHPKFYMQFCVTLGNPHSCEWQRKLHDLGSLLFVPDTSRGVLRFNAQEYPYCDWVPNNEKMWDEIANSFRSVAQPILF